MKNNTNLSGYLAIENYKQVKQLATESEKDELIKNLLTAVADNDLINNETMASEVQNAVVDKWVTIQKIKVPNVEINANQFLLNYFPKAIGIISVDEVFLLAELAKKLDKENVCVGVRKPFKTSTIEIWLVCMEKNYKILEDATDVSHRYLLKTGKDVNYVFLSKKQLTSHSAPKFLIQFDF